MNTWDSFRLWWLLIFPSQLYNSLLEWSFEILFKNRWHFEADLGKDIWKGGIFLKAKTEKYLNLKYRYINTEFMTTEKNNGKKIIETKYGQIKVTKKFKYLWETICNNGSKKTKITKLERLSFATGNIYNKNKLSSNAKNKTLQHGDKTSNFVRDGHNMSP